MAFQLMMIHEYFLNASQKSQKWTLPLCCVFLSELHHIYIYTRLQFLRRQFFVFVFSKFRLASTRSATCLLFICTLRRGRFSTQLFELLLLAERCLLGMPVLLVCKRPLGCIFCFLLHCISHRFYKFLD